MVSLKAPDCIVQIRASRMLWGDDDVISQKRFNPKDMGIWPSRDAQPQGSYRPSSGQNDVDSPASELLDQVLVNVT